MTESNGLNWRAAHDHPQSVGVQLDVDGLHNSVKVKSDVGEVKLTVPGGTKYAVTTDTTVGSADVAVDQDSSSTYRLDVSTTVGAIQISKG